MRGSRWYLLAVLTVVGTMNWADRQVVPILFPGIRAELSLSDTELGIIGGLAFSLIYALSALGFGYAADRYQRKRVILFGLLLWSAATAAGGLATGFWTLFAARFVTGIGEASLYPCALSLIGERFAPNERGRALGIFQACAAIGSGLGIGLGGKLAELLGWREVFFLYGGVGLLTVPLLLSIDESPRNRSADDGEATVTVARELLADRRLRWIWGTSLLAMACAQGFAAWGPSYFVRNLGFEVAAAGALFGLANLIGGIGSGIAGGALSDRWRRARAGGEYEVAALCGLLTAALLLVMLAVGSGLPAAAFGLLAVFPLYAIFPGLLAAVLTLVPEKRHGVAGAINVLAVGGIGAACGPFAVGLISDLSGSLGAALALPALAFAGVGLAANHLRKIAAT